MSSILLRLKDIQKTYRSRGHVIHALRGVTIDIYQGEILGLLGVNGAGKTTLSSIIASLHPASAGEIGFNGSTLYDNLITYRQQLGFCPQKPNLDPSFTIDETLTIDGELYGMSKQEIEERKKELIAKFGLEKYVRATVDMLSGGYKQRFLIARALMHRPKLVILDEPTVGLDPHIRRQLWDIIKELKHEGVTVILTTHYLDEAEVLADRVVILDKGLVRLIDTPDNLKKAHEMGKLEDVFIKLLEESSAQSDEGSSSNNSH